MSKCSVCGRPLTSPASIARGAGAVCAQKGKKGGKRHNGRLRSLNGLRANMRGEPMKTNDALAAIRRVAGIGE